MDLKLLQKESFQKKAEATGYLMCNNIANKITKIARGSQQNNSETAIDEHYKEIPKERDIPPEQRQEIIDKLRLK